jgi:hypothetical protein
MTYNVSDIVEEIRVALDQNMSSTPLATLGDIDTLSLDELIESKIANAARIVEERAPRELLDAGDNIPNTTNIGWPDANLGGGGASIRIPSGIFRGHVSLPVDFLRLLTFKMSDWYRPVTEAITEADPLYMRQFSEFPGIRGNPQKPVVAIVTGMSGLELEFFSSAVTSTVSIARYVKIPAITTQDDEKVINICEKLKPAVVYYAAYLVALATQHTEQQTGGLLTVAKELARIS